jgi:anti-sigma B factor antagonist
VRWLLLSFHFFTLIVTTDEIMKIVRHAETNIAVLSLVGDPLGEPDAQLLRKTIGTLVEEKIGHVIIDLRQVKHINSAGLGGLISSMFTMLRAGGGLSFAAPGFHVQETFRITNLDKIFNTYPSVEEALKNFNV